MKTFRQFKEEALAVKKPSKEKPTANHPAEDGVEGDKLPPKQGSSEDPKLTHNCAMKVLHKEHGEGRPLHSEHAIPDADGNVAWYKVMFEHGIETCDTTDLDVLLTEAHSNHKKKGY
mgnify:FL=1|tara:strand:- start:4514 stop:4864 length:351 start_codon:yes stop_codon:yes gene_type:complete